MSYYKKILNENTIGHKLEEQEIKKIQECLLILLNEIMEVCDKYDIKPFLCGGNLIGLVRHNGFIPWDDDLDLAMLREDYEKFSDVFDKELSDRYVISDPVGKNHRAYNRFIQIGRKNTELYSMYSSDEDELRPTNHIFIDIFPLDYVDNNRIIRSVKGIYANFLMMIGGCVLFKKDINKKSAEVFKKTIRGRIELIIRMIIGTIFSFKSLNYWFHCLDRIIKGRKETNYLGLTVGTNYYFGEIYRKNVILPLKKVDYCGVKVYSPNDVDSYLKKEFGDYMEIPPVEKRECHHILNFKVLEIEK